MKRYSILSMYKWTGEEFSIFNSDDFSSIMSKYNFILKHIKYMKVLSPSKSNHRIGNLQVFKKIYKELHTNSSLYPCDLLDPNIIVLRDNKTNLIISNFRFHKLMGGLIPNEITLEYLTEQKEVNQILSSIWQDYTKCYSFKYFRIY